MPTLTLLHTNDLHGQFDQMTRLGTLVQRQRALAAAEGRAVLLLDAGDSTDEAAWECRVTKGRANFAMLEAMGCDAAVLGNTETQWDAAALEKLAASVHFPVLAANLLAAHSNQPPAPGVRAYAMLTVAGVQVAVAGVTVDDPGLLRRVGYRSEAGAVALGGLVPHLRAEGAQVVIVLSHMGLELDKGAAAAAPGIDVIVGGHSHTALHRPHREGGTVIVQAGHGGNYLGRIDLAVNVAALPPVVAHAELIACDAAVPPDPTLSGVLELVRFEAEGVRKKGDG